MRADGLLENGDAVELDVGKRSRGASRRGARLKIWSGRAHEPGRKRSPSS